MKNLVLKVVNSVQEFLLRRLCSELQGVSGAICHAISERQTWRLRLRYTHTSSFPSTALGRGPGRAVPVRPEAAGAVVQRLAAVQQQHAADLLPQARPSQPRRAHERRATGAQLGVHRTRQRTQPCLFNEAIGFLFFLSFQVPSVASQVAQAVAMASLATTCDLLEQQAADRRPETASVLVSLGNYFYSPASSDSQSPPSLGNINKTLLKPTSGLL